MFYHEKKHVLRIFNFDQRIYKETAKCDTEITKISGDEYPATLIESSEHKCCHTKSRKSVSTKLRLADKNKMTNAA